MSKTVNVLVTGAAGQIGYALLPRLVNGETFGPDTRVNLRLVEIPAVVDKLKGVVMELEDCAFPMLNQVSVGSDMHEAAGDAHWALLVGSVPRGIVYQGKKLEERSDLLKINGDIFVEQGKAIGANAAADCSVLVVGNPANTNCLIGHHHARSTTQTWMAMTALDANRASALLAARANRHVSEVRRMAIWGNHSPTMYPDAANATVDGTSVAALIDDPAWLQGDFLSAVQQRGKAVIEARGASSAFSAANAAIDTVRAVHQGTAGGDDCLSVALRSSSEYDIAEGLFSGFPVSTAGGQLDIVPGFALDDFARQRIDHSIAELLDERDAVKHLLV